MRGVVGFAFADIVDARRGGHVQAAVGADFFAVVNDLELAGAGFVEVAGGAVRFVDDGEVKRRGLVFDLRGAEFVERLVGAEHDAGGVGGDFCAKRGRDARRVGGDFAGDFVRADVLGSGAAGGFVRADDGASQRAAGVRQPFATRLRDQRDGGGDEQNRGAGAGRETLGDAQGGEGFAGAASHD